MVEASFKMRKPVEPRVLLLQVAGARRISPNVVRVRFAGDGLADFTPLGFDQWFRLFLPRAGQDTLRLPTRTSMLWYAQYLATPKPKRPYVRNYTVRQFRRACETEHSGSARTDPAALDVDFIVHADTDGACGPATAFALNAQEGDQVGVLDQGVGYNPRHEHDWTLLVADETGIPAVAGICASLPATARGLAIVEIAIWSRSVVFPRPTWTSSATGATATPICS
jgi:NADPH-dependent ferric siderophore reductase